MQRSPYSSRGMLYKAFSEAGYETEEVHLGSRQYARFTSPNGKTWFTKADFITYPTQTASVVELARDKELSTNLAGNVGVSIPKTLCASNSTDARKLFNSASELIVKPLDSSASRGLTRGITTIDELDSAIKNAQQFGPEQVIIQEQVDGDEVRFVVMNGDVKAALLRQTPRIICDGKNSISHLIVKENQARSRLDSTYVRYPQIDSLIVDEAALTDMTVLPEGVVYELGKGSMVSMGASIYNVFDEVHNSYIEVARELTRSLGTDFIVIDLIIKDITKPQSARNYWFLEFNTAPALRLFYACRDAEQFDIMSEIVRLVDRTV
jgi:cyanophycin synthetase